MARELAAAPPAPAPVPRGRVQVAEGQLRSDLGTPLRGLLFNVDFGWSLEQFDFVSSVAQTTGLNAVHVYLENWTQETGAKRSEGDALVSLTAQAGLYLVLGIGGGPNGDGHAGTGWFDIEKVRSFWTLYADRYKDSSHVLFEVQATPEDVCDEPLKPETVDMEREAYALIRSLAPDSHVVLYSMNALPKTAVLADAIASLDGVVDWSNASIGLHTGKTCAGRDGFWESISEARSLGAPLFVTQVSNDKWSSQLPALERHGLSWMHFHWLASNRSLPDLIAKTQEAGLEWCPDQGSFPMGSATCSEP